LESISEPCEDSLKPEDGTVIFDEVEVPKESVVEGPEASLSLLVIFDILIPPKVCYI
jgi:hypothetical protein